MTMVFRGRDGVCIEYEVSGIDGSNQYPYLNHIGTLKEAVAIARAYPGIYGDGAATHIIRRYSKKLPDVHEHHHSSGYTHRWRVDAEGRIQLIVYYNRSWHRDKPKLRLDLQAYKATLPAMPNPATTLQGQLADLASIAERIGLNCASRALQSHIYGWQRLPDFGTKDQKEIGVECVELAAPHAAIDQKPFWRRVIEKAMTR